MKRLNVKRLDLAYCLWESVFLCIQVRTNKRSVSEFEKGSRARYALLPILRKQNDFFPV